MANIEEIKDCKLIEITSDTLVFQCAGTNYGVPSSTPIQSDNALIKPDLIDVGSCAILHRDKSTHQFTKVHIKKRIARKTLEEEFLIETGGFSRSRLPLSILPNVLKLSPKGRSIIAVLEAKFPFFRKIIGENSAYSAVGVGLMEILARKEAETNAYLNTFFEEEAFYGFFHSRNKLEWLESKASSEEFRRNLIEKIRAALSAEAAERAPAGSQGRGEADQVFALACTQFTVKIVRICLEEGDFATYTYRARASGEPGAKVPKVYLFEDSSHRFYLLASRRQLSIEGFNLTTKKRDLPSTDPSEFRFSKRVVEGLQPEEADQCKTLKALIGSCHSFLTATVKAAPRWKKLTRSELFPDLKVVNNLRQGLDQLRGDIGSEHDPDCQAIHNLVSDPSIESLIADYVKLCSKCQERAIFDLGCHWFCGGCLEICISNKLKDNSQTIAFSCPKRDCGQVKAKETIREVVGWRKYRQIEEEAGVPQERQSLQCSKCLQIGGLSEVCELSCPCSLCIHCLVAKEGRTCSCGIQIPEEVTKAIEAKKIECCKCREAKSPKNNFVVTPCLGHWLCKHCFARFQTNVGCPVCGVVFTLAQRTEMKRSLIASCSLCKAQQELECMLDTTCSCDVCFDCARRSEYLSHPFSACPNCKRDSLTQRGKDKLASLRKRAVIR